ncbi:MAG: UPF0175 family protein [Bacteroidia bacterium]
MPQSIQIHFPAKLALTLKLSEEECQQELKKLSIIKLFELGKISSGMGAKVLGMSRVDFLDMLGKYKVSIFSEEL